MARVREMPSFFLSFRPFPFCVISREEEDKTKMNTEKHNMIDSHPIDSNSFILRLHTVVTVVTNCNHIDLGLAHFVVDHKRKEQKETRK